MIEALKPYADYKESGVPWLGNVPEHWEASRIKNIFRETEERRGNGQGTLLSLTRARGLIPQSEATNRLASAEDLSKYKVCRPGQLVMNRMQAWSGMFAVARQEGVVSPDYSVFHAANIAEVSYFEYLFKNPLYIDQFAQQSKGIGSGFNRLYTPDFGAIPLEVPPKEEQKAIVEFLRHADNRINRLIHTKRRLIELLNEQKQAIIHRAMTRGLDPTVPLKPSSILWLGEIPKHWEVKPLRQICSVYGRIGFRGYTIADLVDPGCGALSLSPGNLRNGQVFSCNSTYISFQKYEESPEIKIYAGDILIVKTGSTTGKVAWVGELSEPATINPQMVVLKSIKVDSRFLAQALSCDYVQAQVQMSIIGGSIPTITQTKISSFRILLPPKVEQEHIVEYLKTTTAQPNKVIIRLEREIGLLREYQMRLVADVVTGKLDVRGVELPAMDDAEVLEDINIGEDIEAEELIESEEVANADE